MQSTEREVLKRITVDPEIFSGKPIARGMRIAVELDHGAELLEWAMFTVSSRRIWVSRVSGILVFRRLSMAFPSMPRVA